MREIEQIDEIKRKLDRARALAIEIGGGVLAYLVEIAMLEAEDMKKNAEAAARGSHNSDEVDELVLAGRGPETSADGLNEAHLGFRRPRVDDARD